MLWQEVPMWLSHNEGVVAVKVDVTDIDGDDSTLLAFKELNIRRYPALLLFGPAGNLITVVDGYPDSQNVLAELSEQRHKVASARSDGSGCFLNGFTTQVHGDYNQR
jgi:hypothetical protein